MDRIQELLGNITNLSDDELRELADLVASELSDEQAEDEVEEPGEPVEGAPAAPAAPHAAPAAAPHAAPHAAPPAPVKKKKAPGAAPFSNLSIEKLTELAEAASAHRAEVDRRAEEQARRAELSAKLAEFQGGDKKVETPEAPTEEATDEVSEDQELADAAEVEAPEAPKTSAGPAPQKVVVEVQVADAEKEAVVADAGEVTPEVPEDRKPQRRQGGFTAVTAGADLPGFAMGSQLTSMDDLATAMSRRIDSMRGIRGGDGDKLIVASAALAAMADRRLSMSDAEGNLRRVMDVMSPRAIVAAGGLGAPEESKYDLFDAGGSVDRPVRDALPVFTADRGGVRFMRPPTLNDVNGVVGIWTVQNDIDAATNPAIRKPSFRVAPGPEIVVDIQAITMIMTFGNLMTRAYPELVKRHTDLALVAQARVAEQQLLTQIGALSTAVSGRTQKLSAVREVLLSLSKATASYRNRHRISNTVTMRCLLPVWFREVLRADIAAQHPGDGLEIFALADNAIDNFFSSRNVKVTWTLDGEAGQDYSSLTNGAGGLADFPANVTYYLFVDGTFAFMDGGTLDLGLVRDSTLNAANDYQMFVETFENVVKFGHESLRVTHALKATGQGSADVTP